MGTCGRKGAVLRMRENKQQVERLGEVKLRRQEVNDRTWKMDAMTEGGVTGSGRIGGK